MDVDLHRGSGVASPSLAHLNESAAPSPPPLGNADTTRSTNVSLDSSSKVVVQPLDLMGSLKRAEPSVVKTRTGSVLSRGFILKTDYHPSGQYLSPRIYG